jgi:hypothetical protein
MRASEKNGNSAEIHCRPAARGIRPVVRPVHKYAARRLQHDPEKWMPVFGKDHASSRK